MCLAAAKNASAQQEFSLQHFRHSNCKKCVCSLNIAHINIHVPLVQGFFSNVRHVVCRRGEGQETTHRRWTCGRTGAG